MRIITQLLPLLITPLLATCHTSAENASPAGIYTSTTFIVSGPDDGPMNLAAIGGLITLRLHPDGTTSGLQRLAGEPGTDLRGRYTISGDTIRFEIADAENVLNREPMILEGNMIRTQEKLRRGPFELVLTR